MKGTLNTVAKDAKVQLDFNPAFIRGYRLVGYENRLMDAEDFEDDTKDGGEVGAGQQVTVLYELVTTDSDLELPSAHSRYTADSEINAANADHTDSTDSAPENMPDGMPEKDTGTVSLAIASESETDDPETPAPADGEYLTVSIRYKDPDAEESHLKELAVTSAHEVRGMDDNMSWAAGVAQTGMLLRGSEYAGSSDYEEVRSRLQPIAEGDGQREEFLYLITRLKGVTLEEDSGDVW